MSTAATVLEPKRIDVLFDELAELTGQRNAIDGRIVDIIAEIDHDGLWGNTGCRSLPALVAWRTGTSPRNAEVITAIAHRSHDLPPMHHRPTPGSTIPRPGRGDRRTRR